MHTKYFTLFVIVILAFSSCKVFQFAPVTDEEKQHEMNAMSPTEKKDKNGKCYVKSQVQNNYTAYFKNYAVYIGDESKEDVDLEFVELVIKPSTTKWVKKKADRNCQSADPNDCLVWCLVEIPAETREFKVLIDTTQSQNYEIKNIRYEELEEEGVVAATWTAVLCQSDVTLEIISQIQNTLIAEKYLTEQGEAVLNQATKSALDEFQRDNNLPVGQLDFETLEVLGVKLD